ncbi:hypothetical protein ACQPT6_17715 [Erwinia amylovora]|uniref:hypothetical protein n=1 Tax=Erwinia amylovora TaxID=552 RepID=UPI003D08B4C1
MLLKVLMQAARVAAGRGEVAGQQQLLALLFPEHRQPCQRQLRFGQHRLQHVQQIAGVALCGGGVKQRGGVAQRAVDSRERCFFGKICTDYTV